MYILCKKNYRKKHANVLFMSSFSTRADMNPRDKQLHINVARYRDG